MNKSKPKKLKKFSVDIKVQDGDLLYDNFAKFGKNFAQFKQDNEGGWALITFESIDKVRYYFHKFYRGELLEVLAQDKDVKELYRLHLNLKYDFLKENIKDKAWENIPNQYMVKGIAIVPKDQIFNVIIPSGRSIVLTVDNEPVEIIPSHAALNNQQMQEFIQRCEDIRDNLFSWRPSPEALEMRGHFFKEDGQGDLFND